MAAYPALGRRPMKGELLRTVRRESRFLLVCAPQMFLLVVLTLAGLGISDTVRVLIWVGPVSLGFGVAWPRAAPACELGQSRDAYGLHLIRAMLLTATCTIVASSPSSESTARTESKCRDLDHLLRSNRRRERRRA